MKFGVVIHYPDEKCYSLRIAEGKTFSQCKAIAANYRGKGIANVVIKLTSDADIMAEKIWKKIHKTYWQITKSMI